MDISELRQSAIEFLDNGGGKGDESCSYCQGKRNPKSSDNPEKAIISLKNDRQTSYKAYIAVQNELVAAYNDLRNREFARIYPMIGINFIDAQKRYSDPRTNLDEKQKLKPLLDSIKVLFPQKLSEAEPSKTN